MSGTEIITDMASRVHRATAAHVDVRTRMEDVIERMRDLSTEVALTAISGSARGALMSLRPRGRDWCAAESPGGCAGWAARVDATDPALPLADRAEIAALYVDSGEALYVDTVPGFVNAKEV